MAAALTIPHPAQRYGGQTLGCLCYRAARVNHFSGWRGRWIFLHMPALHKPLPL